MVQFTNCGQVLEPARIGTSLAALCQLQPCGCRLIVAYDAWGNQTSATDPNGATTTTAYDTTGNWPKLFAYPTSMTQPLVGATTYTWDKIKGHVTRVVGLNSATTDYLQDQWGRQQ